MSEENRPNLNAVGLMTDIIQSIDKYSRGKAGEAGMGKIMLIINDEVIEFVEDINTLLDDEFSEDN